MAKKSLNLVGAAGEYYVCAELCRLGYLGLLATKNNPLYDVVATNQSGSRSVAIQVKTRAPDNRQGWKLGKKIEEKQNDNLFIILVNLNNNQPADFFIYRYNELSKKVIKYYQKYINIPKKDGTKRKDVDFRWYDIEEEAYKNNWEPILDILQDNV